MNMTRRLLIIGATAVVALGLVVAGYFFLFSGGSSVSVAPAGSATLPAAGSTQGVGSSPSGAASGAPAAPTTVAARLVKIDAGPVAPGEATVDVGGGASSTPDVSVSYIERQSGNVFKYLARAGTLTRTSDRTLPGIESALWLPGAAIAFVRYLSGSDFSTVNTYALPADGSAGFFLPQDLADLAVASTSALELASGVNGSQASLAHTDGTHAASVFTTPLSSLRVSFAGKSQYLAFTKPAATLPGDAFLVGSTGHFSRIAGPLDGLVALASPSGKWVLVSYTLSGAMQMELVNAATGAAVPLPVATIADKCVWAADDSAIYCGIPVSPPSGYAYPDDWYQGTVQFSDRIWKIDVAGRYAQLVLDFSAATNASLDAEALSVDRAGTELVFVNKNDGSLWGYSL